MTDTKEFDAIEASREIIRTAIAGSLATLDATGAPFASLVTIATCPDGSPIFRLSDLAVHTANLKRDPRASLLLVAPGGEDGNPLAGARVTLNGTVEVTEDPEALRRFTARQGKTGTHSSLSDFNTYRMTVTGAHLVAGFGRIAGIPASDLIPDYSDCADLLAGEAKVVEHMNDDHPEAIGLYATKLLGLSASAWRLSGCDPDGVDLISPAGRARLPFPERARTVAEAGGYLKAFARDARSRG